MKHQGKQTRAVAEEGLLRGVQAAESATGNVNAVFARVGALGPAASIEFDAPAITVKKSGQFLVCFTISGTDATPSDTITATLALGFSALLVETLPTGADGAGTWNYSISFLDNSLSGGGVYKLVLASVGGHNLTVGANHGAVSVIEQP